jgi:BirA family transcriptional regulator, biotin operon repressor / biotin---[acetyl-CoA-carboxylase] ligase
VIKLDECDSTNNYLKSHFDELKNKLPVLITSALQTFGRGRDQRTWVSPKGKGLYSSFGFVMKTDQNIHLLPFTAGISVIETLEKISGLKFDLKWPNDILYDNKKIAGILIENIIMKDDIHCIAGIGINLNHAPHDFPLELENIAVSLKMATCAVEDYKVDRVNSILSEILFQWLEKMKKKSGEEIIEKARLVSAFMMNKTITFHRSPGDELVVGVYKGINDDGGLKLEIEEGKTTTFYSGLF